MPHLEDAPSRPSNVAATGNQNNGDQRGGLKGIRDSKKYKGEQSKTSTIKVSRKQTEGRWEMSPGKGGCCKWMRTHPKGATSRLPGRRCLRRLKVSAEEWRPKNLIEC